MKTSAYSNNQSAGFTLLEVIVVFTVAGVLFSMMLAYFGTNILDSAQPVVQLNQALSLTETAERITAHYRTTQDDLTALETNLNTNPGQYGNNYQVTTGYIQFTNYNDVPSAATDILKVRIRHDETNETITLVFTKQ